MTNKTKQQCVSVISWLQAGAIAVIDFLAHEQLNMNQFTSPLFWVGMAIAALFGVKDCLQPKVKDDGDKPSIDLRSP